MRFLQPCITFSSYLLRIVRILRVLMLILHRGHSACDECMRANVDPNCPANDGAVCVKIAPNRFARAVLAKYHVRCDHMYGEQRLGVYLSLIRIASFLPKVHLGRIARELRSAPCRGARSPL